MVYVFGKFSFGRLNFSILKDLLMNEYNFSFFIINVLNDGLDISDTDLSDEQFLFNKNFLIAF